MRPRLGEVPQLEAGRRRMGELNEMRMIINNT